MKDSQPVLFAALGTIIGLLIVIVLKLSEIIDRLPT